MNKTVSDAERARESAWRRAAENSLCVKPKQNFRRHARRPVIESLPERLNHEKIIVELVIFYLNFCRSLRKSGSDLDNSVSGALLAKFWTPLNGALSFDGERFWGDAVSPPSRELSSLESLGDPPGKRDALWAPWRLPRLDEGSSCLPIWGVRLFLLIITSVPQTNKIEPKSNIIIRPKLIGRKRPCQRSIYRPRSSVHSHCISRFQENASQTFIENSI